ncbi:Protein DEHYDRATION-INDUCED 19 homolog 2 [Linum grandiflorum]
MEDDKWSIGRLSSASSRSFQLQDRKLLSDLCIDFEEDTDDYLMADYPCPYCEEDFDLVELCCHIDDEHPYEPSSEKLKRRKGDSRSPLSSLKKEVADDYWSSLFSQSSGQVFPSTSDLLLSFIQSMPSVDKAEKDVPFLETQIEAANGQSEDKKRSSSAVTSAPLSDKELTEKTNKSRFVQGLLLSTMFDDDF